MEECVPCLEMASRWTNDHGFENVIWDICQKCMNSHKSLLSSYTIRRKSESACDFCIFKKIVFSDGIDHLHFEKVFMCPNCSMFMRNIEKNIYSLLGKTEVGTRRDAQLRKMREIALFIMKSIDAKRRVFIAS